jgi:type I restriction enzyme M protein
LKQLCAFRNLDETLRKDAGCSSGLDYIEATSWLLFLKYLDDFENDKVSATKLNSETYTRLVNDEFK